jgi:hypothetical protein
MRRCLILRDGKVARTRIDTKTTGAFRGTDGSNPVPSSGESPANLTHSPLTGQTTQLGATTTAGSAPRRCHPRRATG